MPSSKLPNYLKSYRKSLALSQAEVSFLLGAEGGEKVCRDERFTREPSLANALAYEAIFQVPIRDLFAGFYHDIELQVRQRAKTLLVSVESEKRCAQAEQKLLGIHRIANPSSLKTTPDQ